MAHDGFSRRHFFFGTLLAGAVPNGGFGSVPSLRALGFKPFYDKLNVASIWCGGQGGVDLVELCGIGPAVLDHCALQTPDRVLGCPLVPEVLGDIIAAIVRRVAGHAEGLALDQIRPETRARMFHRAASRLMDRENIIPVHDLRRYSVRRPAIGHVRASHLF